MQIRNVRYRLNRNEGVELKTADLKRSEEPALKELAKADQSRDGWVSPEEVLATQGMSGGTYLGHIDMVNEARKQAFGAFSVVGLRASVARGEDVVRSVPPALAQGDADLSHLPRSAFVPLAEHLAARLARAESYESYYGEPGDRIFHTDISELVATHSRHELFAALAIVAAREGGNEFGMSRSEDGRVHLIQGKPDAVELDPEITGVDLIIHTHPRVGSDGARASQGDLFSAREYDPDHKASVISEDGWFSEYAASSEGVQEQTPRRMWNVDAETAEPPRASTSGSRTRRRRT